MAVNLIDLIRQHLSTGVIGKIGTALGLDSATAEKAVSAAVPALLAALAGLASKREGAEALAASVRGQDQGLLRDLAGSLGGAQATQLAGRGAGTLSSLFGEGGFARLSGAIGSFAGLNPPVAKSLLGMIAPVALGVLGQQLRGGADSAGLSELLQGQKSSIMNALPPGLGGLLGSTGLVEGVSDTMRGAAASAAGAARAATSTAQGAGREAVSVANRATATGGSWLRRLVPLAIILAALIVAYQIFFAGRQTVETTAPETTAPETTVPETTVPETTTAPAMPAAPSLVVNNVDLGQGTASLVETSVATLQGITDAAGAEAALPTLQEIGGKFDAIVGSLGQLAPEGRKALADTATMAKPTLQVAIDKVMSLEGLSEGVKAAISAIQSKLETIAQG